MKSIAFWMARDGCCATLDFVSVYHLLVLKETPPAQGGVSFNPGHHQCSMRSNPLLTRQHTRTGSLNVGASLVRLFQAPSLNHFLCCRMAIFVYGATGGTTAP